MSADNGIYILETSTEWCEQTPGYFTRFVDGKRHSVFRVAHTQAIDNLDYYAKNEPYNLGAYMQDIWGRSPKFLTEADALLYANDLHKQIGYTEYGVCHIDEYKDLSFYGMG